MIPPFNLTRLPLPGITVRSVIWSVSAVTLVVVYALLHRRKAAPVPGRPADGEPLSEAERAAWDAIEDGAMDDVGLAILDHREDTC